MSLSLQDRFLAARELPPEAREQFLADLDASDPTLAERLRALLAAADSGVSALDSSPWADFEEDENANSLPERIGPYRVLSEIGRGGMGRVYLALQEGDGFSRRVAVKVVAPEGAGSDIERRFREERRILAGLEHPGIARFHDAGRDPGGQWFLALEYVEGVDLLAHAREKGLSTEDRLRLFLGVLEAVAYAHARSVVHRDLKPANILVGADGRPRLLDFGIAKLLDAAEGAASATQTHTALRALTPAYASPEQFRGESVTPASDVFALGVLLYELLAGVRPFGRDAESHAALERAVLDTDPEPPSKASRRAGSDAASRARGAIPGGLDRDLDAICLKALRKDPAQRYPSAAALAEDLERHRAGLPVAARGEDRRYRLARFLGRKRAALAIAASLAVAVIAIALAVGASRRAAQDTSRSDPEPRPFRFSDIAGADIGELEGRFSASPADVDAGARLAIALEKAGRQGETALVVARLRQIPGHAEDPLVDYVEASAAASSNQPQLALVLYNRALERAIRGARGDLVAQIRASRGYLLYTQGRRTEAKADMESARRSFEEAKDLPSLARVLNDLAMDPLMHGELAEGEKLLEQALAVSRAAGSGGIGIIAGNLAMVALQRGYPDRSEIRFREAMELFRASKNRLFGWAQLSLSEAMRDLGRPAEADRELSAAIVFLADAPSERGLANAYMSRGSSELARGDLERTAATAAEIESLAKSSGDRSALAFSNRLRGEIAAARGDLPEARRLLSEARRQLLDNAEGDWAEDTNVVGAEIELAAGELAAARDLASSLRPEAETAIETTSQFLAESLLLRLEVAEGRVDLAKGRIAGLEAAARGSTSVRRGIALARAQGALASAEGRVEVARRELATAADLARDAGRGVEADALRRESRSVGDERDSH